MKHIGILMLFIALTVIGCKQGAEIKKEPWVDKPLNQWPSFALTNEIGFDDTTFTNLANAFLIDTGADTLGASCKHIFMVFRNHEGLRFISLGENFDHWKLYPKNNPERFVQIKMLINENKEEPVGQFNTLKNRDWIIFDLQGKPENLYPLKIRYTPLEKGEVVYALGWGALQEDNTHPVKTTFQCFRSLGNYYYAKSLTKNVKPDGRSGSPVIDKNGYLVGITSGAEGKLTVIGSIQYLKHLFDSHQVDYKMPGTK
ncbi:MAG: trypsin-like serine protease [Bacteroidales bacterium]|nr:trypsin-like serine protease [Bacteroidales bacterium]